MIKKLSLVIGFSILAIGLFLFFAFGKAPAEILSPLVSFNRPKPAPKPLEKYYFENLRKRKYLGGEIILEKTIKEKEEERYTSWLFSYQSDGKKVTGMANLPKKQGKLPVIIMLRGYVDDEIYFTGLGTRKAASIFAENGFITLAPDFLGFGGSDSPSKDILEARFTKPITVLNLITSIESLAQADEKNIFLWGHSNGGQIALSVLEITQKDYPTVLWAPVTKAFPESILNYIDGYENLDELGKRVYNRIKQFEQEYDCSKVSINSYFQDIESPVQLHQGGQDYLVPQEWSDGFYTQMRRMGKDISYFKYPDSDHNLKQDWDEIVEKDLSFFRDRTKD